MKKNNVSLFMSLAVICSIGLTGCSNSPSASNFSGAIQRYLDKNPECLIESNYPGRDHTADIVGLNEMSQALAKAGVLKEKLYKRIPASNGVIPMPAETLYSYKLTSLGKNYYVPALKCFSFARKVVKITNYTKEDENDYEVEFTYKYSAPQWVKNKAVVGVARQLSFLGYFQTYYKSQGKPIKSTAELSLTHNGWRAQTLDW
jgi:hypothetical protein